MSWELPPTPDDPRYRQLIAAIRDEKDPALRAALRREACHVDFWLFVKLCLSFGRYRCGEPEHAWNGKLWIDHPDVFECCREIQRDMEDPKAISCAYFWSRFTFKTSLITVASTLWRLARDRQVTVMITMWKIAKTGSVVAQGFLDELREAPVLAETWPETFLPEGRDYTEFTAEAITVQRVMGPREPSISVHPTSSLPTGTHYDVIIDDDLVTRETVASPESMEKADQVRRDIRPLGKDATRFVTVGTVWSPQDPNAKAIRDKRFDRLSVRPAFKLPPGKEWTRDTQTAGLKPFVHSRRFYDGWREFMGEYDFACLAMQSPIATSEQAFQVQWMRHYPPTLRQRGWSNSQINRVMLIDPAGMNNTSTRGSSDFFIWRVVDLVTPNMFYHVDLWRERVDLPTMLDLTFALVAYWRPEMVWVEEFGTTNVVNILQKEQQERRLHFKVQKILEGSRTPKKERIRLLQMAYEKGRMYYPQGGFGHGSGAKHRARLRAMVGGHHAPRQNEDTWSEADARDTYIQFREDEYDLWNPSVGKKFHDDMLDCEAWLVQPLMSGQLRWPTTIRGGETTLGHESPREFIAKLKKAAAGPLDDDSSLWAL